MSIGVSVSWRRWVLPTCSMLLLASRSLRADPGPPEDADFGRIVTPFLRQHCLACHGADRQKGGVRYDRLTGYRSE
ncbi:MAG: hypothetical protein JNM56_21345, partial [Planctomycetia bacterium]|nr:hypothetical protein [Planctomycetia bacterium]